MLKYFNKDKKKQPQFQGILTEEEFFDRKDFEISTDFWKMNNTQLEDVANKQEKYIKNLKKNYAQLQEFITAEMQKSEDEKRKLRNEVEELQIKNEANIQQKSLMETQFKDMYEKQQKQTEVVDLLDLANVGDVRQQELNKLRDQMIAVCEEMRKLKDENDDLSAALEGEKIHKEKQIQSRQQIIDKLENQLKEKEQQYNKKVQELETEIIQLQTEINEYILKNQQYKDLDNKLLQEKLRADQYKKDVIRLEDQIKEYKLQIEQYSTDYLVIVGKSKLLEQKRVKYKQQIQQQQNEIHHMKEQNQQNNLKLINDNHKLFQEIEKLNDQIKEIQDKQKVQTQQPIVEDKEEQFRHSQLELKLQDSNLLNFNLQKQIINLEKQIDQITDDKDKIISHLNQKRENAIQEIELLNKRLTKSCQNSSTDLSKSMSQEDRNTHHDKKPNKRIQIFPTLNASLIELRKIEDACYKIFIQFMIQSDTNKEYIVKMEMHLNDISRRTQDLLDLLEEFGLK
ncbi:hypothetical protein pb186bvf_013753 [Paramecium bursaria]